MKSRHFNINVKVLISLWPTCFNSFFFSSINPSINYLAYVRVDFLLFFNPLYMKRDKSSTNVVVKYFLQLFMQSHDYTINVPNTVYISLKFIRAQQTGFCVHSILMDFFEND